MTAVATEPWFVAGQRVTKADKIARALYDLGASADDVAHFADEDRRMVEIAAGVRKGSALTWRLVADMLAGSHRPDALCPTCGLGDPLGDPGPRKPYLHEGRCAQ